MKKNVAGQVVGCQLTNKTDGSPVTTGTTTVYVTGDGGVQAVGSVGAGACTHEGNGYWTYAPAQAETNYDLAAFTFVNTSACNVTVQIYTSYPQTGDSFAVVNNGTYGNSALNTKLGAPAFTSIADDIAHAHTDVASISSRIPAALSGGKMDSVVAAADTRAAVGLASANLDTQLGGISEYIDTEVSAIKAKTDTLPASFPTNFASMGISAGGVVNADVKAIDGDSGAATKNKRLTLGNTTATCAAGCTTTSIVTSTMNPAASVTDQFKGCILSFDDATTTAALRGQKTDVTASTALGVLTVTALTTAPASGDTFTLS